MAILWFLTSFLFIASTDATAPPTATLVKYGIAAAVIVAALVGLEQAGRRVGGSWLIRTGNGSYSLYLLHLFVVGAGLAAAHRLQLQGVPLIVFVMRIFAACLVAGTLCYLWVERPLYRLSPYLLTWQSNRHQQANS